MTDVCVEPDGTIGTHEWVEKEVRVHLDSRTYKTTGVTYTWECRVCGAVKKETGRIRDSVVIDREIESA